MWLVDVDFGRGEAPAIVDGVEQCVAVLAAVGGYSGLQVLPGFVDMPGEFSGRGVVEFVEPSVVVSQAIQLVGTLQQLSHLRAEVQMMFGRPLADLGVDVPPHRHQCAILEQRMPRLSDETATDVQR